MTASGKSKPGCHSNSALLSKKRAVKPVGARRAARLRLKGPAPTPTASSVRSASVAAILGPPDTLEDEIKPVLEFVTIVVAELGGPVDRHLGQVRILAGAESL